MNLLVGDAGGEPETIRGWFIKTPIEQLSEVQRTAVAAARKFIADQCAHVDLSKTLWLSEGTTEEPTPSYRVGPIPPLTACWIITPLHDVSTLGGWSFVVWVSKETGAVIQHGDVISE